MPRMRWSSGWLEATASSPKDLLFAYQGPASVLDAWMRPASLLSCLTQGQNRTWGVPTSALCGQKSQLEERLDQAESPRINLLGDSAATMCSCITLYELFATIGGGGSIKPAPTDASVLANQEWTLYRTSIGFHRSFYRP